MQITLRYWFCLLLKAVVPLVFYEYPIVVKLAIIPSYLLCSKKNLGSVLNQWFQDNFLSNPCLIGMNLIQMEDTGYEKILIDLGPGHYIQIEKYEKWVFFLID